MRLDLTIAIPTYNRANELKQSLELTLKYCEGKNVDILVSDNASTDGTEKYIKEVQKSHSALKYYRNSENLGFDGNFFNCFEKATGEYIWLMSDDDLILPGAIDSILIALKKKPACMHLNSSRLISTEPLVYDSLRFKEEGVLQFSDKNIFLKTIGIYCTFVSSLVFNTDCVKKIRNKERYFKTNLLQSHIFLESMNHDGKIFFINTYNCLAAKSNSSVRYDVLKTWVQSYSELLLSTAPRCGFESSIMSELLEQGLSTTIYEFIIFFRKTCKNEGDWDRECIWKYVNRYPKIKKKYRIAVNCPTSLLSVLLIKYKIERKIKWLSLRLSQ